MPKDVISQNMYIKHITMQNYLHIDFETLGNIKYIKNIVEMEDFVEIK